jgi:hypothetical protein
MKQNLILWIAAAVITFLAGFLQNRLNEYYPVSGSFGIEGKEIGYKLDRVYYGDDDYKFFITSEINGLEGKIYWKKPESREWRTSGLTDSGKIVIGRIPHQKPLTKIEYLIKLNYNDKEYSILPGNQPVTMTFFSGVPASINFYYMFTLLGGLLLAVRTGLEYFKIPGKIKTFNIFTLIFFTVNVFAFHPLKKSYELGMIGKGAIPLTELFQFSSILLFVTWVLTTALIFNTKNYRIWAPAAAIITIIIIVLGHF